MHFESKLLYRIVKQYKLVNRMKVRLSFLEAVSIEQNILMKDLIFLLGISKNGYYKLLKGLQHKVFINIKKKVVKNYNSKILANLIFVEKANKDDIDKLKETMKLTDTSIMKALGISRYSFNKLMMNQRESVRVIDIKAKETVELLKVELKNRIDLFTSSVIRGSN